jgi:prepilin-type N-terminal cleavage/methylation domain-containing protein
MRRVRRDRGFTLLELLVVVLIVGVLAAVAIPQYAKTLEDAKADDAAAIVKMIGTTNRMFQLDNEQYVSGLFSGDCSGNCPTPISSSPGVCVLIQCRYLAQQDFSNKGYTFRAIAGGAQTCSLGTRSPAKPLTTAKFVACAKRCSGAPPCTNTPRYQSWGYAMDDTGVLHAYGDGADFPPDH